MKCVPFCWLFTFDVAILATEDAKTPTTSHIPIQQGDMQKRSFSASSSATSTRCCSPPPQCCWENTSLIFPSLTEVQMTLTGPTPKRTVSPRQCIQSSKLVRTQQFLALQRWHLYVVTVKEGRSLYASQALPPEKHWPQAHHHTKLPGDQQRDWQSFKKPLRDGLPKGLLS